MLVCVFVSLCLCVGMHWTVPWHHTSGIARFQVPDAPYSRGCVCVCEQLLLQSGSDACVDTMEEHVPCRVESHTVSLPVQ